MLAKSKHCLDDDEENNDDDDNDDDPCSLGVLPAEILAYEVLQMFAR